MRDRRHDRGSYVVELAFLLPILVLLVLGIANFGLIFMRKATLSNAASFAVNAASTIRDPGQARSMAESKAREALINSGMHDSDFTIDTGVSGDPPTLTVNISYNNTLFGDQMLGSGMTSDTLNGMRHLSGQAQMSLPP